MNQYARYEKSTGAIMAISNQPLIADSDYDVIKCNDVTILHYVDISSGNIVLWSPECQNETINELYKYRVTPNI